MRPETVEAVRRFSRFYTRSISLLGDRILGSPYSLPQVRFLYEIAHTEGTTAADLARSLGVDPAQASRILRGLEARGLVAREPAGGSGRRRPLALTEAGAAEITRLEEGSKAQLAGLLDHLSDADERTLRQALVRVQRLIAGPQAGAPAVLLRPPRPGDYGWVIARHGAIYAAEYGWDETFEALVAEIVAAYARDHDPRHDRAFIAEVDGEPAGSVFLVRADETTAKLRLLFLERWARGHGLGRRLVDTVVDEARALGYRRIVLWTNDCLTAAVGLYEAVGFRLTASEPHRSFGHDLVGQTWQLDL